MQCFKTITEIYTGLFHSLVERVSGFRWKGGAFQWSLGFGAADCRRGVQQLQKQKVVCVSAIADEFNITVHLLDSLFIEFCEVACDT